MERKLTRFLTLLVSLLVLVSLCATTAFAEGITTSDNPMCYLHGDVNGDGEVGTQDAIYTLYYAMWHDVDESLYPMVNQGFDFTGEGNVSAKDALYLLWASLYPQDYPLDGEKHEFYVPYWTWDATGDTPKATLTVRCGCGEPIELKAECTSATTEATCVAAGKIIYTAKVTYQEEEYTDTYTVSLPVAADGHEMVGVQGCETASECQYCDYKLPALGHNWVLNGDASTAATCQQAAMLWYDCACGANKTVEQAGTLEHAYQYVEGGDHLVKDTTCTYVKTYKCATCSDVIDGTAESDIYVKHSYTVTLTKEANCQTEGEKTYTCTVDGCGATKTAVAVSNDDAVSKDQLSNELKLENNTTVSLDQATVDGLEADKNIKISVTEADLSSTGLTEEQKAQVGDNTVYDFNMAYDDGTPVTDFTGYVTVSLPYTLAEGEDIDAIDIWYIDDQGELAQMKGTYSNGYVTFETDHFSYYTVTRLTPAERCARYGHIIVTAEKAATCTEDGYSMQACQRCGAELEKTVYEMQGHSYKDTSDAKAATCTEDGLLSQQCERCDHKITAEIPALGHNMQKDETNSSDATCEAPGVHTLVCANGCGEVIEKELAQLQHSFENSSVETEHPTCNSSGKKHQTCVLCGEKIKVEDLVPLGHDYVVAEGGWKWSEDRTSATVDLICKNNEKHKQTRKAAVEYDKEKSSPATCTSSGYLVYTATSTFNRATFTDSVTVEQEATGHLTSGAWQTNANQHYRLCDTCGEKADVADHNWGERTVTKEATCKDAGSAKVECQICGYSKTETIPATGEHDLVDGKCSVCGFSESTCDHVKLIYTEFELDVPGVCEGMMMFKYSCACGKETSFGWNESNCEWGEEVAVDKVLPDGTTQSVVISSCTKCGLVYEWSNYERIDEGSCTGYYIEYAKLSHNGTTIIESERNCGSMGFHYGSVKTDSVDLSELGMCGGTLELMTCNCGGAVIGRYTNDKCTLTYDAGLETCSVCGVSRRYEYVGFEQENCKYIDTQILTFQKDGKSIYTYEEKYCTDSHNYKTVKYELEGESCEDGVVVYTACADCGRKNNYYSTWHEPILVETTDLTGYGSCATEVQQLTCACGQEKSGRETYNGQWVAVGELAHNFSLVSEDPNTGDRVFLCDKCNYTETQKTVTGEKDENCRVVVTTTHTYTDGKGHSYSYVAEAPETRHNYQQTVEVAGTSCDDGVTIRNTCTDCGTNYVVSQYRGHQGQVVESYDLADYGLCNGEIRVYACACGRDVWTDGYSNCRWYWDDENQVDRCELCGATRAHIEEVLATIDGCHERVRVTDVYTKDGQEVLKIQYTTVMSTHRMVHTFTLNNPAAGCSGGYRVKSTCLDCGESYEDSSTYYHHESYPIDRKILSTNALCGDLELVTTSCACGERYDEYEQWHNGECDFRWVGSPNNDKFKGDIWICTECGAERRDIWHTEQVEGETCRRREVAEIAITKNGKDICSYERSRVYTSHARVYTYNLLGQTCADGYTYSSRCAKCDKIFEETSDVYYDCGTRCVEIVPVAQHPDICGEFSVSVYSCACGAEQYAGLRQGCDGMHWSWDNERNCEVATCITCGVQYYNKITSERIPGTCKAKVSYDYSVELNGQVLGTYKDTFTATRHQEVTSFELLGETCEDGYNYTVSCAFCGQVMVSGTRYGHGIYPIAYYDLSMYGMCGGEIWVDGCACGDRQSCGWNESCNWQYVSHNEQTNTDVSYCTECNTYRYLSENYQRDPENCAATNDRSFAYVRDDVTLLEVSTNERWDSHEWIAVNVTLMDPEGTCEDGVYVEQVCEYCGMENKGYWYHHESVPVDKIDLSDGCGGYIRLYRCACGQEERSDWDYGCTMEHVSSNHEEDADGNTHNFYKYVCPDCGLTREEERYSVEDNCVVTEHQKDIWTYGDKTLISDHSWTWDSHEHQYLSAALIPGAASCKDGVNVSWKCVECGKTGTTLYKDHVLIARESIDLETLCGATLEKYSCACGQSSRYDFGPDTQCDVDQKSTEHWIEGVIHDAQDTSEGWVETYSYAYTLKCAVSDPEPCGMTIRMAEYWLKEGCEAVEYQTWQLGYDEKTGTWEQELTIPTGARHAYHAYEYTEISETLEDGSRVSGYKDTCPDCGSYYFYQNTYLNDNQTKYEHHAVNKLDNGENKEFHYVSEYGFYANDYNYRTLDRYEYVYADGSSYWYQHAYTDYDFSGDCKCTSTYTSSNGGYETRVMSAHIDDWDYYYDPAPTCSQHGTWVRKNYCRVCEKVYNEYREERNPTKHDWNWDYDKQVYVCSVCALESATGATGSITLEDLTAADADIYTVGYWNEGNIEYNLHASVIMDEKEDDKELALIGISFDYLTVAEDGVRAVTFSKAAAQDAAITAMENVGYTGSYAIRISFVPTNPDDTLDYAITFDSQNTEQ